MTLASLDVRTNLSLQQAPPEQCILAPDLSAPLDPETFLLIPRRPEISRRFLPHDRKRRSRVHQCSNAHGRGL